MAFARNRDQLIENGFQFVESRKCARCKQPVEYYQTPKGRQIPLDPMAKGNDLSVLHFTTCKNPRPQSGDAR